MPADERPIENGCPGRLRSLRAHFQLFVAIFDNKTMQRLSKRKYMRRKSVGYTLLVGPSINPLNFLKCLIIRIGVYPMTPPAFNSADTCKVHVNYM